MLKAARDDGASPLKFTYLLGETTGLDLFPECFPLGRETLETESTGNIKQSMKIRTQQSFADHHGIISFGIAPDQADAIVTFPKCVVSAHAMIAEGNIRVSDFGGNFFMPPPKFPAI
jgi:hypothetical protein